MNPLQAKPLMQKNRTYKNHIYVLRTPRKVFHPRAHSPDSPDTLRPAPDGYNPAHDQTQNHPQIRIRPRPPDPPLNRTALLTELRTRTNRPDWISRLSDLELLTALLLTGNEPPPPAPGPAQNPPAPLPGPPGPKNTTRAANGPLPATGGPSAADTIPDHQLTHCWQQTANECAHHPDGTRYLPSMTALTRNLMKNGYTRAVAQQSLRAAEGRLFQVITEGAVSRADGWQLTDEPR